MAKSFKGKVASPTFDAIMAFDDTLVDSALEILAEERDEALGSQFIHWICLGKEPRLKGEDDRLLWNSLLFACNREFGGAFVEEDK